MNISHLFKNSLEMPFPYLNNLLLNYAYKKIAGGINK